MCLYYVYIIKSLKDGTYYKGFTTDYLKRFHEHNFGLTHYTHEKRPWELIYVEILQSKKEALIREKKLKKCNRQYFEWLRNQPINILNQ